MWRPVMNRPFLETPGSRLDRSECLLMSSIQNLSRDEAFFIPGF